MPGAKRSASVSGVGRPAYSRRARRARAKDGRPLASRQAASSSSSAGIERLRDEAAAVLAEPAVASCARRRHVCANALVILDPGRRLEARARVDRPRPNGVDRLARRSPGRARRRASAARRPRARARDASRPPAHGRSTTVATCVAVPEQDGVAAADSARPRARRAGRGRRRVVLLPTTTATESTASGTASTDVGARGLSCARTKPQRSAPARRRRRRPPGG